MLKKISNSKGSSLVESIVVLPILIILVVGFSVSLLWGWARLEISTLSQELLLCQRSEKSISDCRNAFERKLRLLPGAWKIKRLNSTPQGLECELTSRMDIFNYVFKIQEQDPWKIWKAHSLR